MPSRQSELSGGNLNTIFDESENAFGFQSPGLTREQSLNFFVGNSFFNQNWVTSPASTTARDGLGPTFNARSCSSCHFKDGRGQPPTTTQETSSGMLLRLSLPGVDSHGGPIGDPIYGNQLNDQSIQGVPVEGNFAIDYTEFTETFDDGTQVQLRIPNYSLINLGYGAPNTEIMISPRIGQQLIGLGLLEAIPETQILMNEDPDDLDNDGVSGKANFVWDIESNSTTLGRFGWKSNQPSLLQQTAGAFLGDIGITSDLFPNNNCTYTQEECLYAANGGIPEIELADLKKTVLYVSNLAVPARRNYQDEIVFKGQQLFFKIGCEKCHISSYTTGSTSDFSNLTNQKIWPYTDLLLHDMGDSLADNRPDYLATGNEWRTPPLWGIGLIEKINHHTMFLHDGRARTLEEAILWHGGEATSSRNKFKSIPKNERAAIIKFLESL